jgi:pyruvate kinase
MLSAESATGKYPEESVAMLAKIAAFTETHRPSTTLSVRRELAQLPPAPTTDSDRLTSVMERALEIVPCDLVLVPTRSGATARLVSRLKPPMWLIAPSRDHAVCQGLAFSYGVYPVQNTEEDSDWRVFIERWLQANHMTAARVLLIAGPSHRHPQANHRIELMRLDNSNSEML